VASTVPSRSRVNRRIFLFIFFFAPFGCQRRSEKTTGILQSPPLIPQLSSDAAEGPCPEEMGFVTYDRGRVCVDKYEGAIAGWRHSLPLDGYDASSLRAVPAKAIKPQVNISERQAESACTASSKRLCTEAEWTAACRGPSKLLYPYGDQYVPGACNEGRPGSAGAVFGGASGPLDDPRLAEADNAIEPGGAFPKCVSAFGIFDMHGNVHEWVSGSPNVEEPQRGLFLGGFFADAKENGPGCLYRTTAHAKEYHDYSTGFRCCKDALRD
jgi:sulfatase modifying factor 1